MSQQEAYDFITRRLGFTAEQISLLVEIMLDQTILNPIVPETVGRLGKLLDLRPGKTMLDLACGKGGVSLPLVYTYKVKLTGVDIIPDFIREAWSRAEYSGIHEFCNFITGDAADFTARSNRQWDAVLILGALPMIWEGLEAGLDHSVPLVKPGGSLVIGVPYQKPDGEQDPNMPWPSREEITALMGRVGRVVETLDDGAEGWAAYIEGQEKGIKRLREEKQGNPAALAFIDQWAGRHEWERKNIGFALWIVQVPEAG
ncbi:MAG: class I SAM-dependent methyltransferase [Proteobacteria bacterium]|nr:class I SAM-dependent methyltransferase [Pseudomonadota bacterium]